MVSVPEQPRHLTLRPLIEESVLRRLDAMFVLNSLAVGGSESKVVRLANSLQDRGAEVGVVYLNPPHSLLEQLSAEIPVWHLDRRGKYSLATLAALRHLVHEQRPRSLVAVSLYPTLYVVGAARCIRRRPRAIGLVNTTSFNPGDEWRRRVYRPVLRWLDWTVYGCELQLRAWLNGEGASTRQRSSVIYNGVDTQHFHEVRDPHLLREQRSRLGIGERTFVLGTVGRLAPEKGQVALLDAAAQMRAAGVDVHVLLVGDGPVRPELEKRAAELGLSAAVTFAGAVLDVRPLLATMDVFVLPSLYVETFSNAALEAMAMGKPVVLSAIGGAREMIRDEVEGFLVEPQEIARALPTILLQLAADAPWRERVGRAGARRAQSEFSFDAMVEQYCDLIGCSSDGSSA